MEEIRDTAKEVLLAGVDFRRGKRVGTRDREGGWKR